MDIPKSSTHKKIITDKIANSNEECVLCYGHFNIIHPGHLRYFEFAKTYGKSLKAFVQNDDEFNQVENKLLFNQHERANALASMELIDQVILQDKYSLNEIIYYIKPKFLILGKEHEIEPKFDTEVIKKTMDLYGGKIIFHSGTTQYSQSGLNVNQSLTKKNEISSFFYKTCEKRGISNKKLDTLIEKYKEASMLVIGDVIIDQYIACDALGMSAEAPVIVVKEIETKEYIGGAGIVAAHLSALGAHCEFISVVGNDEYSKEAKKKLSNVNVNYTLIKDDSRPTTFKVRYLVDNQKIFRVSKLKEHNISRDIEDQILDKVKNLASNISSILICDFVYGVITPRLIEEITKIAKKHNLLLFGDLQCSSQVGNITKFKNFDLICPTEREARISLSNKDDSIEKISNDILELTNSKNLIMKLGANGFITYSNHKKKFIDREHFPSLTRNPIDVTGAGDSLLAGTSLSLACGADIMTASVIGASMASIAIQSVGNFSISKDQLLTYLKEIKFHETI